MRARCRGLALAALILLATSTWAKEQVQAPIPHIDDCDFCQRCIVDTPQAASQLSDSRTLLGFDLGQEAGRMLGQNARRVGNNAVQDIVPVTSSNSGGSSDGAKGATMGSKLPADSYDGASSDRWGGGTAGSTDGSSGGATTGSDLGSTRGDSILGSNRQLAADEKVDPLDDPSQPEAMRSSAYRINQKAPKSVLPNCTVCRGCNTQLSFMEDQTVLFDRTFTNEKGATSGWLFRATTNHTATGTAILKVYCMPLPKRPGARVPLCAPEAILKNMRLLLAIEKVVEECGFEDIVPAAWVDKINAPIPGIGFHIRWHGLWMEVAEGVSMENLLHKGEPSRFPPAAILDLMHNKLNKTQVVRAAIFDLLTSQCDRHAQNIFINEAGNIKLIDNEAALQSSWKTCGFNSILVPTTQKQEIIRLSNEFVQKLVTPAQAPKGIADPQLLLDYRCYLPGGSEVLGTEYPPKIAQCLRDIAAKSVEDVKQHYGFLEDLPAQNLKSRATDMITKGFEWAYKYGAPQNAPSKRYRIQPKCCKIKYGSYKYECAHKWEPKFELPIGDPNTGRGWTKDRPDTGTYEGGTFEGDEGVANQTRTRA